MKQQPYMLSFVETSQYFTGNSKLFLCQVQNSSSCFIVGDKKSYPCPRHFSTKPIVCIF